MTAYDAVVLAGGAGRRLGGVDKAALEVGGRPLLDRVLAAVADARQRVVVGPPRALGADVRQVREEPSGGGPAAALGAALPHVDAPVVVVLAADLPFLDAAAVRALRDALGDGHGAVLVDDDDRPQWLAGAWRTEALRSAATAPGVTAPGARLRGLLEPLQPVPVRRRVDGAPAWYDCDTDDDLRRARSWA